MGQTDKGLKLMNGRNRFLWGRYPLSLTILALGAGLLPGCGTSDETTSNESVQQLDAAPPNEEPRRDVESVRPVTPPVASISPESVDPELVAVPQPDKGSPEWLLREIARIRTQQAGLSQGGGETDPSDTGEQQNTQHAKVIELARQVVAATHNDESKTQVFNNAVHYLSDARLQLAMTGDIEQAQLLVEDADTLYKRDPKSFAAVESAFKVVELAQQKAERQSDQNPDWCTEFSRQARLFAEKFPHEANRSAMTLLNAGRLCDRAGLTDDARGCFTLVRDQFPDTIFAEQVSGFLRRLSLVGQPLELAGPTIDGGYVSIDQFQGKPVLIVFWSTQSPQFQKDVERLTSLLQHPVMKEFGVIGVNLDMDESAIDQFLAQHSLGWSHIFYSEPEKRGGKNPTARYYGVQSVPTYWVVDESGIVTATPATLEDLVTELRSRIGKS
ncbi:MAG: TlpA family protein disulfide reductase [Planctomycetaceae bacterium]|nr:TlpA family protein disulfide reductase [Planctomycetaceae bacterium]